MQENFSAFVPEPRTLNIQSKTDALTYAISVTRTADGLHLDKAEQVFRMFVDNIELPDTATKHEDEFYDQATELLQGLKKRIEHHAGDKKADEEETATEAVKEAEKAADQEKVE